MHLVDVYGLHLGQVLSSQGREHCTRAKSKREARQVEKTLVSSYKSGAGASHVARAVVVRQFRGGNYLCTIAPKTIIFNKRFI